MIRMEEEPGVHWTHSLQLPPRASSGKWPGEETQQPLASVQHAAPFKHFLSSDPLYHYGHWYGHLTGEESKARSGSMNLPNASAQILTQTPVSS